MGSVTNHKSARKAYSLIEILIVISVIAVLVAIAVPALDKAREYARLEAARGTKKILNEARIRAVLKGEGASGPVSAAITPQWWLDGGYSSEYSGSTGFSLVDRQAALDWFVDNGYLLNHVRESIRLEDLRFHVQDYPSVPPGSWVTYKDLEGL